MKRFFKRLLNSEDGPTAVEYAVMLALIISVCLAAIQGVGAEAGDSFGEVSQALEGKEYEQPAGGGDQPANDDGSSNDSGTNDGETTDGSSSDGGTNDGGTNDGGTSDGDSSGGDSGDGLGGLL